MKMLVNLSYLAGIEVRREFVIGCHERQFTESVLEYQLQKIQYKLNRMHRSEAVLQLHCADVTRYPTPHPA